MLRILGVALLLSAVLGGCESTKETRVQPPAEQLGTGITE